MNIYTKIKDIDTDRKIKILSCFIIVTFGIIPSFIFNNWQWFSRSGSVLVIFGIYIAWKDYKGEIDHALLSVKNAAKEKNKQSILTIKESEKGIINSVVKQGATEKKYTELSNLVNKLQEKNKNTYDNIEFIILFTGTIIWGYGDLFNKFYC